MTSDGSRGMPPGEAGETEDIDPGLVRARTRLAWVRTAVSFAAVGGAIVKTDPVAGSAVLALGAAVWVTSVLLRRRQRAGNGDPRRLFLLITATVIAVSLIAAAVAVIGGKSPLTPR
jgi:uncharacterized membrane protein YidH (DUF202 family)